MCLGLKPTPSPLSYTKPAAQKSLNYTRACHFTSGYRYRNAKWRKTVRWKEGGSHPKAASPFPLLGLVRNSCWLQGSRCARFVSKGLGEERGAEHQAQRTETSGFSGSFQRHSLSGTASASTAVFSKGINCSFFFFFFLRALACCRMEKK